MHTYTSSRPAVLRDKDKASIRKTPMNRTLSNKTTRGRTYAPKNEDCNGSLCGTALETRNGCAPFKTYRCAPTKLQQRKSTTENGCICLITNVQKLAQHRTATVLTGLRTRFTFFVSMPLLLTARQQNKRSSLPLRVSSVSLDRDYDGSPVECFLHSVSLWAQQRAVKQSPEQVRHFVCRHR